jgi:Ca-activated chloride channel family protein
VGSAPAESLLRGLAEKTGGACELVSPNEDIGAAIMRMLHRMRGAKAHKVRIDWGVKPSWQSPLPLHIYDGETLHFCATFKEAPQALPELSWDSNGANNSARAGRISRSQNPAVARLGGAQRMSGADTPAEALALALKYQLVSRQSNMFLVHLREGQDKAAGLPALQQVPQMPAAGHLGWGSVATGLVAIGSVKSSLSFSKKNIIASHTEISCSSNASLHVSHSSDVNIYDEISHSSDVNLHDNMNIKSANRELPPEIATSAKITPESLLKYFNNVSGADADFTRVSALFDTFGEGTDIKILVEQVSRQENMPLASVWAIVLDWLIEQGKDGFSPSRHGQRLLRAQLRTISAAQKSAVRKALVGKFPALSLHAWSNETV